MSFYFSHDGLPRIVQTDSILSMW
jgi:hypothetical protein